MDVGTLVKRLHQVLVTREVRHDPQFDLGIIGGDDFTSRRSNEGFAYAPAFRRAHRNVLQIGVGTCQAPGHRGRLREAGVHAAG